MSNKNEEPAKIVKTENKPISNNASSTTSERSIGSSLARIFINNLDTDETDFIEALSKSDWIKHIYSNTKISKTSAQNHSIQVMKASHGTLNNEYSGVTSAAHIDLVWLIGCSLDSTFKEGADADATEKLFKEAATALHQFFTKFIPQFKIFKASDQKFSHRSKIYPSGELSRPCLFETQYELCVGNYFDWLRDAFTSKENLDSIENFPMISGPILENSAGARDAIVTKFKSAKNADGDLIKFQIDSHKSSDLRVRSKALNEILTASDNVIKNAIDIGTKKPKFEGSTLESKKELFLELPNILHPLVKKLFSSELTADDKNKVSTARSLHVDLYDALLQLDSSEAEEPCGYCCNSMEVIFQILSTTVDSQPYYSSKKIEDQFRDSFMPKQSGSVGTLQRLHGLAPSKHGAPSVFSTKKYFTPGGKDMKLWDPANENLWDYVNYYLEDFASANGVMANKSKLDLLYYSFKPGFQRSQYADLICSKFPIGVEITRTEYLNILGAVCDIFDMSSSQTIIEQQDKFNNGHFSQKEHETVLSYWSRLEKVHLELYPMQSSTDKHRFCRVFVEGINKDYIYNELMGSRNLSELVEGGNPAALYKRVMELEGNYKTAMMFDSRRGSKKSK